MKANPNSRITIDSLEASETVPFIGLHKTDFKLLVGPAIATVILGMLFQATLVGMIGAAGVLVLSGGIVYIRPSYMTSADYLRVIREYVKRPPRLSFTTDTELRPDSYFERVEEAQATTELTHVNRYYQRGVIERADGKYLAAVRLEPQSMDFAEADEWADVARSCEAFANNSLDFDCQFYITSREFPIESYTETLQDRLEDDDIASLPMIRATLKELIQERPKQLEEANLAPLHFYAIVSVGTGEVITNTTADTSALEKLASIPVLGVPFSAFATFRDNLDELHTRARMLRKLDERVSSIESGLVRNIEGYSCSRVTTVEWVLTLEDYWKSYSPDFNDFEARTDSAPIVGGEELDEIQAAIAERTDSPDDTTPETTTSDADTTDTAEESLEASIQDSEFEFQYEPEDIEPVSKADADESDSATSNGGDSPESSTTGGDGEEDELSGLTGRLITALVGESTDTTETAAAQDEPTANLEESTDDDTETESPSSEAEPDDGQSGLIARIGGLFSRSDPDEDTEVGFVEEEPTSPDPGSLGETDQADVALPEKSEIQQLPIAAEDIEQGYRSVVVEGREHRQVLFVESWPKNLKVGALRELLTRSNLNIDISIHTDARDREEALSSAERRVQSLETDASAGLSGWAARDKLEQAEEAEIVRDQLDAGQQPFNVSIYVVVRADSADDLRDQVRTVRDIFRDAPANMGLKTLSGNQLPGLQSCSPIGYDVVNETKDFNTQQLLLGQGLGCLLSSFKQSTLLEEGGIEFGEHAFNSTPIIKDPFESETNYNWVVIGDSGSGKSYESKEMALRTMMGRANTKLIILDPLEGFFGLSKAMDAEHITIGGEQGLNPLEIRPPADHSTDAEDIDPLSQKIKDVMSFFENFAAQQGLNLGSKRPILSAAIKASYTQQGITHDIATHDRESPTIHDVLNCLKDMAENPENYVIRSVTERESISENAAELISYLRPFVDGAFQNLAKQSEFDLAGEDVVYLDLSQQEHTASGGGIMMQLLFSLVYERAKETPKDVIFLIDEARFLMRDANNLEFLGQRVRHSRHYNTSIRFITQNIGDFFSHEEAESIINNSFINIFHQTEEIEQWADTFGMNQQETRFVKNAQTGQNGYSEALVSINNTRFPIQFFATDTEDAIIDFDPRTQSATELPGDDDTVSELSKEIRNTLDDLAGEFEAEFGDDRDDLDAVYEDLPPTHKRYLSILDDVEFYQTLSLIQSEGDSSEIIAASVGEKMSELFGEINQQTLHERLATIEAQYTTSGHETSTTETETEADENHSASPSREHREPTTPEMDD